jgi:predicted transcriptional regulator
METKFDGAFVTEQDNVRLTKQQESIYEFMRDGKWASLSQIESATGHPQASISAQLRNLRKAKFGGHQVITRHIHGTGRGNYEYQLTLNV